MISARTSIHSDSHKFVSFNNTSVFLSCVLQRRGKFSCYFGTMKFYKALLLASEFPTFHEHSSWYPCIPHHQDQWSKCHAIFWHYRALVSRPPTFAFLCVLMHQTCLHISGHTLSDLEVVCFLVSLSQTMYIHRAASHSIKWISWNLSMHQTIPGHHIKRRVGSSGNVNVFQWNREWFFSRHVQFDSGFHMMTVNEISWDRPKITFGLTMMSRGVEEDPSDSPRRISCSYPLSGLSRIKVDVLRSWSPPEFLTDPSATGNTKVSPFIGVDTSCALSLRAWSSDASIFCNSSMSATNMSPAEENIWKDFPAELMQSRQVFRRNRVMFDHCSKRYNWSAEVFSEPPFIWCLPIRQKILNISQIAATFHGIRPPVFIQTDCNSAARVPSLTLRTALSAIPFVSERWGVHVQWFHDNSSQDLPNSKELSVWMTFGFLVGSRNFCSLFWISWEVFVLHGLDCNHWVAESCTTTAYRWLCRDSLRTL